MKRPILYFFAAALGIALVIPLAISSGQTTVGGIFDECYGATCETRAVLADAR